MIEASHCASSPRRGSPCECRVPRAWRSQAPGATRCVLARDQAERLPAETTDLPTEPAAALAVHPVRPMQLPQLHQGGRDRVRRGDGCRRGDAARALASRRRRETPCASAGLHDRPPRFPQLTSGHEQLLRNVRATPTSTSLLQATLEPFRLQHEGSSLLTS